MTDAGPITLNPEAFAGTIKKFILFLLRQLIVKLKHEASGWEKLERYQSQPKLGKQSQGRQSPDEMMLNT